MSTFRASLRLKTFCTPRFWSIRQSTKALSQPLRTTPSTASINSRNFSSTSKINMSAKYQQFLDLIKERRSVYTLSPESTISDEEIKKILEVALEEAPSTFGSFTTRLVLLVKDEHKKFWDIVSEVIKAVTPAEQWESSTKGRLAMFANSYGTVLFFEDPENTRILEEKFAFAKDMFAPWAQHTSAIHQFIVWTAFANAGLGANLQHYNPIIDEKVKAAFNIPADWSLIAQMDFGKPTAPAGPKPEGFKKPLEQRLIVKGA